MVQIDDANYRVREQCVIAGLGVLQVLCQVVQLFLSIFVQVM